MWTILFVVIPPSLIPSHCLSLHHHDTFLMGPRSPGGEVCMEKAKKGNSPKMQWIRIKTLNQYPDFAEENRDRNSRIGVVS